MPRIPRSRIAPHDEVGIFHCYNRTAKKLTLCGVDPVSKIDYSGRVIWMLESLQILAATMLVDILRVSFMRNHYHLMLRTRPDLVRRLSNQEVVQRMVDLSPNCLVNQLKLPSSTPHDVKVAKAVKNAKLVKRFRHRLSDISWLMKLFGQNIGQRINRELDDRGAVFEGRYKMNRLESPAAVLACALYIDLNPIRAGRCTTPEESVNTSIYMQIIGRLQRAHRATAAGVRLPANGDLWLDTTFATAEDADAWLAPTMLDPEQRLHHQLHRWREQDLPQLERDLTGDDPNLREFLQLVEKFEWVVGRRSNQEPTVPIPSQEASITGREADTPPPDLVVSDDEFNEFEPEVLEQIADYFEQLLTRFNAPDRIASERDKTGQESATSTEARIPAASADSVAEAAAGAAVQSSTSPLTAIQPPDGVTREARICAQDAVERDSPEQLRRVRTRIASCRQQLRQLLEVPEVVRSFDPDGAPTTIHLRLTAILKRCQPQTPKSMLDCNRRGNDYPSRRASNKGYLPITSEEYMVLLDQTGRLIRSDKPGAIPAELPPILERLGLRSAGLYSLMVDFEKHFGGIVGSAEEVARRRRQLNRKKIHGLKAARKFFESVALDSLSG